MRIGLLRILTIALLLATSQFSHAISVGPDNANIQYSGRWNFDNKSQPWVAWQGSSILIRFNGTGVQGSFDPGNQTEQFRVVIDGVASYDRLYMSPGQNTYTLAENLSEGEHSLLLMKETFYGSNWTFYGLEIDGTLLAPPPKPDLRIEFFGDSNMDGYSNYDEKNAGDMGSYYAYPAITSRMLNAEMNLQAVSGAKLDRNGDNDIRSFIISENYYNQDSAYRSGFDPHVIVVNAGANDIRSRVNEIKKRYRNVISDLRNIYGPDPHIILMNGYGWDPKEPANYTWEIVDEIGGNLSVMLFPWLWEQWHGAQWDHFGQAYMLAEHIAGLNTGWSIGSDHGIPDGFGREGDFANGSFEQVAPFGGFGWRYFEDGVQRINNAVEADDGDWYIRLEQNERVHQPTDATGDLLPGTTNGTEVYTITARMRAASGSASAKIETHFEGQELYTHDDNPSTFQSTSFVLGSSWQTVTHTAQASSGVWTIFNYLIAESGTVDIDKVQMSMDTGTGPNQPPRAGFTCSSSGLDISCSDQSTDSDGSIVSRQWQVEGSNVSGNLSMSHSFANEGSYEVKLTVIDDEGAVDTATDQVTVSEPGSADLTLQIGSASLRKNRLRVNLSWSGATTSNVIIWRNGTIRASTANDGAYRDNSSGVSGNTFTYVVCEEGGGVCSEEQVVNF